MMKIKNSKYIHPSLYLSDSNIINKGVFTEINLTKDTTLFEFGGTIFSKEDIDLKLNDPYTTIAISETHYLGNKRNAPKELDDYLNHSCKPNAWLLNEFTLVASRDISSGEEIVVDYSIWINDNNYFLTDNCQCGSQNCRKKITGTDWLRLDVIIENYMHFSPFINKRINLLFKNIYNKDVFK